jgi:hypothetical protein
VINKEVPARKEDVVDREFDRTVVVRIDQSLALQMKYGIFSHSHP